MIKNTPRTHQNQSKNHFGGKKGQKAAFFYIFPTSKEQKKKKKKNMSANNIVKPMEELFSKFAG